MDVGAYIRNRYASKLWLHLATLSFVVAVTPVLAAYYGLIAPTGSDLAMVGVLSAGALGITVVAMRQYWVRTRAESAELP